MSSPGGGTSGSRQACGKGGKSARVEHAATRQLAQPASLRGWGSVYQCTSRKTSGSQLTRESRQQPGHREPVLLGRLTPVGIQASERCALLEEYVCPRLSAAAPGRP